jgi:hypothetical protein
VRYDPADRSKIAIDIPRLDAENAASWSESENAAIARGEAVLARSDADPTGVETVQEVGKPGDPVRGEFRVSSDPGKVEEMKEKLRQRAAQNPGSGVQFPAGGSAAGSTDPVERLEKLADLRDRGALTDAEFAAEKAKILAEN